MSGHVESLLTGEKFNLYLVDERGLLVLPEETHGIPDRARFNVQVPFTEFMDAQRHLDSSKQLTLEDFQSRLGEFRFVFHYNGTEYARDFRKDEIKKVTQIWTDMLTGKRKPRILRRGGGK